MTYKKSSLAILIASTVALTGCLDDNYDYSSGGGGNSGTGSNKLTAQVPLYHDDPKTHTSPYIMTAVDVNGMEGDVDGQENASLENIQVTGNFLDVEPLTVEISEDKASLIFKANKEYDITAANNSADDQGGTVQFYVETSHYDIGENEEPNKVTLTMANGEKSYGVDITSAMAASFSKSGTAQWIRVPLSCFIDQGLDLTTVDHAMGIESEGAIEYKISQARLASNSVPEQIGTNNLQGCLSNNNSEVLTDPDVLFHQPLTNTTAEGKMSTVRHWRGSKINPVKDGQRFQGIEHGDDDRYDPALNSNMTFAIDIGNNLKDMSIPRLDLSHYMAEGELQMSFFMPNVGLTLPSDKDFNLAFRFSSPANNTEGILSGGYGNSEIVYYSLTESDKDSPAIAYDISIPVSQFFTKPNGSISLNAMQYTETLQVYATLLDSEGKEHFEELETLKYGLANLKVVMAPSEDEPAPVAK